MRELTHHLDELGVRAAAPDATADEAAPARVEDAPPAADAHAERAPAADDDNDDDEVPPLDRVDKEAEAERRCAPVSLLSAPRVPREAQRLPILMDVAPLASPTSPSYSPPLVVSLVAEGDDGYYLHKDGAGADADAAHEVYWRQMDEQEGPGAYEREMALIVEMREGLLVSNDDEYSEEGDFEDEEGAEADGPGAGAKYALPPSAWVAGRKRPVDGLEPEAGAEGGDAHAFVRRGTPPKRARTGEREYTTVRLVKLRSEELDAEVMDATDTASAGSAPKRARLEAAESPRDTSTPDSGDVARSPCTRRRRTPAPATRAHPSPSEATSRPRHFKKRKPSTAGRTNRS
ncbi:hypothetical protein B0H17DRAFT_1218260 [Mycena rosella]|uniref:Uncharacterized protein n=1 Tax=Mycena rosella TaxID=1033263 RepID=A0AAD7BSP7_MYCRO|nr:hypothetical protein B0H17DRAFT_1218260 [Mycena rosella]